VNPNKSFSKSATTYNNYSLIQQEVLKLLIKKIDQQYNRIVDLGCGTGEFYKQYRYKVEQLYSIDISIDMLEQHPISNNIKTIQKDFNDLDFFDFLGNLQFDMLISSSALQWSKNLEYMIKNLKALNKPLYLTIFTSNTFKDLHQFIDYKSPIHSKELIIKATKGMEISFINKSLTFKSNYEMMRYIQKSGVSGSNKPIDLKDMKKILNNYPNPILEFEIAIIKYNSNKKIDKNL